MQLGLLRADACACQAGRMRIERPTCGVCNRRGDRELEQRLEAVAATPFERLTYTDAIEVLRDAVAGGHRFECSDIAWGMDLGSEHERCVATMCAAHAAGCTAAIRHVGNA